MPRRRSNPDQPSRTPGPREQAVLGAIIDEHLVTGEAVGSRVLSGRFAHAHGWSPATIRNVMAELEEQDLVEQPHTSAGRVPTDQGYRYYVNHMLGDKRLSRVDLNSINRIFSSNTFDSDSADRIMERASHALS